MKYSLVLTLGFLIMSTRAHADSVNVRASTDDGFATAWCPPGYTTDGCDFGEPGTCDNTSRGGNYCQADSRNHNDCEITAYCRRKPRTVRIEGSTDDGYLQKNCPAGFIRQSCNFDYDNCDNIQQKYAACGADSHHHKECNFSGVCVEAR